MKAVIRLKETWLVGNIKTGKDIEQQEKIRELELAVNDKIDTNSVEQFVLKQINDESVTIECENENIAELSNKGTISLYSTQREFTLKLNEQKGITIVATDYTHCNYFTLKEIIK